MSYLPSKPKHSLINVLLEHPALTRPLMEFTDALMRGPSPFTPAQRETIFAYVSGLNRCEFCQGSHAVAAAGFGAPENLVDELLAGAGFDAVEPSMRPVLDYARKLTDQPHAAAQSDVDKLLAAGWDETALVHLAWVAAIANMFNRVVSGLGIEADPAMMKMGGEMLHRDGYLAIGARLTQTD